jgi:hypothetical protein
MPACFHLLSWLAIHATVVALGQRVNTVNSLGEAVFSLPRFGTGLDFLNLSGALLQIQFRSLPAAAVFLDTSCRRVYIPAGKRKIMR